MKNTHRPYQTRPLNNITIPLAVERAVHLRRVEQIRDDCNHILESDNLFTSHYRTLRDGYTSGLVKANVFKNTLRWQVASCLRRAGLPLHVARAYQALSGVEMMVNRVNPTTKSGRALLTA